MLPMDLRSAADPHMAVLTHHVDLLLDRAAARCRSLAVGLGRGRVNLHHSSSRGLGGRRCRARDRQQVALVQLLGKAVILQHLQIPTREAQTEGTGMGPRQQHR